MTAAGVHIDHPEGNDDEDEGKEKSWLSLAYLVFCGVDKKIEKIEAHCVAATKQWNIKLSLDRMESIKSLMPSFSMKEPTALDASLRYCGRKEILLEEQSVRAETLASSEFVGPHSDRINTWLSTLHMAENSSKIGGRCKRAGFTCA